MNQTGECEEEVLDKPTPDGQPEEKRSYYYDDAHGYEDFDPDTEEDEEDEEDLDPPAMPGSDRPRH